MKILMVTAADERIGGVPYVVGNLARHLQSRGHDIIFFQPGHTLLLTPRTTKWGFTGFELNLQLPFGNRNPLISFLLFCLRFPVGLGQLIWLVQSRGIQVVNIHYPSECLFYFALCRCILPIALITSVHGADLFPDGRPKGLYPRAMQSLLERSDRIVVPSNAYGEDVASVFPQLRGKLVAIHNGVDLNELGNVSCASVNGNQPPYILCIAMHNEKKAIDVLLRAFAQIRDSKPQLRLVLAGDGPLRSRLEDLAGSLGIEDRVEFLGRQERPQVAGLLHGCEVFVLPSRSEPFGIVILEAMACAKPVVATSAGGIPEIIENGKNGLLVDPEDPKALAEAVMTALNDDMLRREIARNGYFTVQERFCTESTGAAYEAVFAQTLNCAAQRA